MLIPVEMCQDALTNKTVTSFQLFVYLKSKCSGQMRIEKTDISNFAKELERSERTIRNHLENLQKKNWIGYSKKSGYYFIRGFDKVRTIESFKTRACGIFDTRKIKEFKAFVIGVLLGYLIHQQRKREWALERKNKRRSKHNAHKASKYYPVANSAFAKILGCSISTAYEWKKLACKHGYVRLKKNFTKTGVVLKHGAQLKKAYPDIAHRIRKGKKQMLLQEKDTALSDIRYKRRKKIETYRKRSMRRGT